MRSRIIVKLVVTDLRLIHLLLKQTDVKAIYKSLVAYTPPSLCDLLNLRFWQVRFQPKLPTLVEHLQSQKKTIFLISSVQVKSSALLNTVSSNYMYKRFWLCRNFPARNQNYGTPWLLSSADECRDRWLLFGTETELRTSDVSWN